MTIDYIIPEYIEGIGDCTKLLTATGKEKIIEKNIDTVLKQIMKDRLISQRDLYRKTYELTKMKRNFPLYLTNQEMLITFKCRKIKSQGDRAFGYINQKYIHSVYRGKITTLDGKQLDLLERQSTFMERMEVADDLKNQFQNDKYLSLLYNSNQTKNSDLISRILKEIYDYIKK